MTDREHIAILGAGPVGLEAALAAAEAGFPFTLYEAEDEVAGHIREWGHVRLFTPWEMNVSPRMARALAAAGRPVPGGPSCPTGAELIDQLLQPLAELPQLAAHIRCGNWIEAVGREGLLKHQEIATAERAARPFRLLVGSDAGEHIEHADIVLDCTGSYGVPNSLGDGGIPAPGELQLDGSIWRIIPDFDEEADDWAGRRILLAGAGHSAQTAARDLAALAEREGAGGTRVLWVLRSEQPRFGADEDDPLAERAALAGAAQRLADGASPAIAVRRGAVVEALADVEDAAVEDAAVEDAAVEDAAVDDAAVDDAVGDGAGRDGEPAVEVTLRYRDGRRERVVVDRILSLTGAVGDHGIYRQLQVHECYATSGPMKLAAALLGAGASDCLDQESHGADTLVNPEPNFFILGAKSYGRNNSFLLRVGYQQVEEVFGLL